MTAHWIQRASKDMPGARQKQWRQVADPDPDRQVGRSHTTDTAPRAIQLSVRRRPSTAVVSAMQPWSAAGAITTSGGIDNLG